MKFATILALLPTIALGVTVSYDETYDKASNSLNIVACSNGENGLITAGFSTFGSLPKFPHIGGASVIAGFNSVNCGTCWELTSTLRGVNRTINVLAIDHTDAGFNIALSAMNELTNNQAVQFGRVNATSRQVAASVCGLTCKIFL